MTKEFNVFTTTCPLSSGTPMYKSRITVAKGLFSSPSLPGAMVDATTSVMSLPGMTSIAS